MKSYKPSCLAWLVQWCSRRLGASSVESTSRKRQDEVSLLWGVIMELEAYAQDDHMVFDAIPLNPGFR